MVSTPAARTAAFELQSTAGNDPLRKFTQRLDSVELNYWNTLFSIVPLLLTAGCATTEVSSTTDSAATPTTKPAQAVSREIYDMIQCSHCDHDFERVTLPGSYDLPIDDLGVCLAYVLDQEPENRNLLISAMMECIERTP